MNERDDFEHARHHIANLLSIAQVNIEAILDGVVEYTPERLDAIRESLIAAGRSLENLKYR